jgi:hypothetical protein
MTTIDRDDGHVAEDEAAAHADRARRRSVFTGPAMLAF